MGIEKTARMGWVLRRQQGWDGYGKDSKDGMGIKKTARMDGYQEDSKDGHGKRCKGAMGITFLKDWRKGNKATNTRSRFHRRGKKGMKEL